MKIFFSSDPHFGHANIIRYTNRPVLKPTDLDSTGNWLSREIALQRGQEMDNKILRNYNERMKPGDMLYMLGDFSFRGGKESFQNTTKVDSYLNAIQCNVILVNGNHDSKNGVKSIIQKIVAEHHGCRFAMVHNPIHCDFNYKFNLCGHVHKHYRFKHVRKWFRTTDLINVGVDVWNFYPITMGEILHEYSKWKRSRGYK